MTSRWIFGLGLLAVSVYALGLAACGDDDSPGVAAGGTVAGGAGGTTAGGTTAGGTTAGGTTAGGTTAGGTTGTGGTPVTPTGSLAIDSTGWVARDSNTWGIQGAWYWYSDAETGGQTVLTNTQQGVAPFEAGGMCLHGTTPGGGADAYITWGAGIGLNLNQEDQSDATPPLTGSGIQGFDITITGSGPSEILVKFLPQNPMPGSDEAPSVALSSGTNHVLVASAVVPDWAPNAGQTGDPNNIAAVQIQANAGATGGAIDLCVTGIAPF